MFRLLKFAFAIALLPLLWGLIQEAATVLVHSVNDPNFRWFFAGLGVYVMLFFVGLRHYLAFLSSYVHESTHAIVAWLTLRPVTKLLVYPRAKPSEEGSHIKTSPGFLIAFSCLAPYCLPLVALPFLIARRLVPVRFVPVTNLLIGLTMGFFYVDLIRGFGKSPTDFPEAGGFIFSAIMIVLVNTVLLVVVLSFVTGEYAAISDYLRASWSRSQEHYKWAMQMLGTARQEHQF